jgi:hypothetical protein
MLQLKTTGTENTKMIMLERVYCGCMLEADDTQTPIKWQTVKRCKQHE